MTNYNRLDSKPFTKRASVIKGTVSLEGKANLRQKTKVFKKFKKEDSYLFRKTRGGDNLGV